MSNNVNGNQELNPSLINRYKEMYNTASGNTEDISDEQIKSIFESDLKDGKIDGIGLDDDDKPIELVKDFKEKVSKEEIDKLTEDVAKLSDEVNLSTGRIMLSTDNVMNNSKEDKSSEKAQLINDLAQDIINGEKVFFFKGEDGKYTKNPKFKDLDDETYNAVMQKVSDIRSENVSSDEKLAENFSLNEQQIKLAKDIYNGTIKGWGWQKEADHPFNTMSGDDRRKIRRAAAALMLYRKPETDANAGKNTDVPAADNKTGTPEKPAEQNSNALLQTDNKTSGAGTPNNGNQTDGNINQTRANDKSTKYGIQGFDKMTKKEKKEALKERKNQLEEQIKAAEEKLKANPDDRDTILLKEKLEDDKEAAHKAYRTLQPSLLSQVMGFVSPILGLASGLGGIFGISDGVKDVLTAVSSTYNNGSKLIK